jgi:hypothetical protein
LGLAIKRPRHRLSILGVATSARGLACPEVPREIAMLGAVCDVSVPLAVVVEDSVRQAVVEESAPHALVEDDVSHAAVAVDEVEDSALHAVVEDSVSHAVAEDSAPRAVVVEDSMPQAVVGDSVHADAVFPSVFERCRCLIRLARRLFHRSDTPNLGNGDDRVGSSRQSAESKHAHSTRKHNTRQKTKATTQEPHRRKPRAKIST